MMTTPGNGDVRIQEFAPTLNPQFRSQEPAALLHAAGDWLAAHPDANVVALNLTNFDLLGQNPHGGGYMLDLVVDQGAVVLSEAYQAVRDADTDEARTAAADRLLRELGVDAMAVHARRHSIGDTHH